MSNSQTKNFNSVPNPSCSNYLNILTCQRLFPIGPCHENLLRLHTEKIANDILSKQLNLNHHILCNIQLYLLRVLHVGNHNTKTNIWYSMHNKCILCVIHNYCISSMWATIMLGCASLHPTTLHQYHQSYNLKVLFTYTNQHSTPIQLYIYQEYYYTMTNRFCTNVTLPEPTTTYTTQHQIPMQWLLSDVISAYITFVHNVDSTPNTISNLTGAPWWNILIKI